jgi:uncharacterized protein (TIGR02231 family)
MRRVIWSAALAFFVGISVAQADVIKADSKITAVTVYPGQALVTRSASVELPAGSHQIVFENIIPQIDENSIRVSGAGNAKVKLFGAQLKRAFSAEVTSEKAQSLEKKIQDLEDQKAAIAAEQQVLAQEREFLYSLRFFSAEQISKDLVTKMPAVKDVGDLLIYLDTEGKKNFAAVQACVLKTRSIDQQIDVLRQELAEISSGQKMTRAIVVDVEAPSALAFDVQLSFLVNGAFWQPIYDARAAFDKGVVDLVTYGLVKQTTGEDWTEVEMTLSTSRPSIGGRMPYVAPWVLNFFQPQPRSMAKGFQYAPMLQSAKMSRGMMAEDAIGSGEPPMEEAREVYAEVGQSGTGVTYKIARPATVKADGTDYRLPVGAVSLKSDFRYAAFPRASEYAYLNTTVVNEDQMQLPAGALSVFLDGDFVGRSSIDNVSPGEKFDLYLGVDENVKVKRERLEQKTDDTLIGGLPSPTVRVTTTNRIRIENYKTKNISVYIFDSMPVSENDQIKVRILSVKPEPKEKDWEKRKGVWRWEFNLKPREKTEIVTTFTVEYPRNTQIEGL